MNTSISPITVRVLPVPVAMTINALRFLLVNASPTRRMASCWQAEKIIHVAFAATRATCGYLCRANGSLDANQVFRPAARADFRIDEFLASFVFVAWHNVSPSILYEKAAIGVKSHAAF